MSSADACEICGKPTIVRIGPFSGGIYRYLCSDCHNREMAELYDTDMPDNVPERLTIAGRNGRPHDFDIEFMIFGTGKSLCATEIGKTKRKADVWGSLDDHFDDMLETLKRRIKKVLSVKYMDSHGSIKDQKLVGYIDYNSEKRECVVFIDGKPYAWDELGRNISAFEGWKIKIEFAGVGDELD